MEQNQNEERTDRHASAKPDLPIKAGGVWGGRPLDTSDPFEMAVKRALDLTDRAVASELWAALANVGWEHVSGAWAAYSFRAGGDLIAAVLGEGDYLEWYCCGVSGVVTDRIRNAMASEGWSPVHNIGSNIADWRQVALSSSVRSPATLEDQLAEALADAAMWRSSHEAVSQSARDYEERAEEAERQLADAEQAARAEASARRDYMMRLEASERALSAMDFRTAEKKKGPAFITFTGLDAWTDLDRAEALSRRYAIEWGVLFSPRRQGVEPRYPALKVVAAIVSRRSLRLAAHLCGGYARSVLAGEPTGIKGLLVGNFGRFQINTDDPQADPRIVRAFAESMKASSRGGILQCRGSFPSNCDVDWLADESGGRGERSGKWPTPIERGPFAFVGYAGGLGPETVTRALADIQAKHPPNTPYWIDMESGIRTGDRLDLDKCEAVCRAVFDDPGSVSVRITHEMVAAAVDALGWHFGSDALDRCAYDPETVARAVLERALAASK